MERKLATLQQISIVHSHPNADRLDLVQVKGWTVVVAKGEVEPNDWCVYFEIDSFLPEIPEFEFLYKSSYRNHPLLGSGYRLKTQKLRGIVSQGLLIPLDKLRHLLPGLQELESDLDVTEQLTVRKWEDIIPTQLQGFAKGLFPSFLRKTDQERIESCADEVFSKYNSTFFESTLKLDGSSCTVYHKDGELGVCSRNLELKMSEENETNAYIRVSTASGLLSALEQLKLNIAVSAELMGPGIQGNRENLKELTLFVFDIWDIDNRRYLGTQEREDLFIRLKLLGFTGYHVPVLAKYQTLGELGIIDVPSSKIYVDRPSLTGAIAEGCVFKSSDGLFSFKSINNRYLLKYSD